MTFRNYQNHLSSITSQGIYFFKANTCTSCKKTKNKKKPKTTESTAGGFYFPASLSLLPLCCPNFFLLSPDWKLPPWTMDTHCNCKCLLAAVVPPPPKVSISQCQYLGLYHLAKGESAIYWSLKPGMIWGTRNQPVQHQYGLPLSQTPLMQNDQNWHPIYWWLKVPRSEVLWGCLGTVSLGSPKSIF